ncbi:MAG: aerial mycelium formation protein [Candidatus Nanopelagicales bacterium]
MTRPMAGGRRRVDRVLAPDYLDDLRTAPLDVVRGKRHEAEQEEADLSFARRMLHGRMDIIKAEQARRADPEGGSLVERLSTILADPSRSTHGSGRHLTVEPSRVDEHRRKEEAIVADAEISDVVHRTDAELDEALARLRETEVEVSEVRHDVQHVMDALTEEIARRYREGEASVDDLLAHLGTDSSGASAS